MINLEIALLIFSILLITPVVAMLIRRQFKRALAYSVVMILMATTIWLMDLPVYTLDTEKNGGDIVYFHVTDPLKVNEMAVRFKDEVVTIIVSKRAYKDVAKAFEENPKAKVETLSDEDSDNGLTLAIALRDLTTRLEQLQKSGGNVYFVAPRSNNLKSDKSTRDQLVAKHNWLNDRLKVEPSSKLPSLKLEAPTVVSADMAKYPLEGNVINNDYIDLELDLWFVDSDLNRKPVQVKDGQLIVKNNESPTTKIVDAKSLSFSGKLPVPGEGRTTIMYASLKSQYGEPVSAAQAYTRTEVPEIGVLIPKGKSPKDSHFYNFLQKLGLEVRAIELDLSEKSFWERWNWNTISFDPDTQLDELVSIMSDFADWQLLVLDITLSKAEGDRLAIAIAEVAKKGSVPHLFLVGTDGWKNPPKGWHRFLENFEFKTEQNRYVAFTSDLSGSMGTVVEKFQNRRKIDIARDIAKRLEYGLKRRDSNLIYPLCRGGKECKVEEFTQEEPAGGDWEGGDHLKRFAELVRQGKPISDIIMFWDNVDILGVDKANSDDLLSTEQVKAAKYLVSQNVRLHVISIGGALNSANADFIKKAVKVDFNSYQSYDALLTAIERDIFQKALPRLTVQVNHEGLENLEQAKSQALQTVASNPQLLLLNTLAKFKPENEYKNQSSVLMWVKHYHTNKVSPILMKGSYGDGYPVAYLSLDLVGELAKSVDNMTPRRNAIADLIIASLNAITERSKNSPVFWYVDPTGKLTVMKRNRTPFNLVKDSISINVTNNDNGKQVTGQVNLTNLVMPAFDFTGLSPNKPREVRASFEDYDPKIGKRSINIPMFAMPALPLSPAQLTLIGQQEDSSAKTDLEAKKPFGISSAMMTWIVAISWLFVAGILIRF